MSLSGNRCGRFKSVFLRWSRSYALRRCFLENRVDGLGHVLLQYSKVTGNFSVKALVQVTDVCIEFAPFEFCGVWFVADLGQFTKATLTRDLSWQVLVVLSRGNLVLLLKVQLV